MGVSISQQIASNLDMKIIYHEILIIFMIKGNSLLQEVVIIEQ